MSDGKNTQVTQNHGEGRVTWARKTEGKKKRQP